MEEICLNRNDKIRCLKTVQREKKKPSRVYHTPTTQTKHRDMTLTSSNKRTKTTDISGGIKMAPKYTDEDNPNIPYIPLKTDEIITPIPENQAETAEILAEIKKKVRKRSFEGCFDGKIAVSYSDSK